MDIVKGIMRRLTMSSADDESGAESTTTTTTTERRALDELVTGEAPSLDALQDFLNLDKSTVEIDEYESELHDCISTPEHKALMDTYYKGRRGVYYLGGMVKCEFTEPLPEAKLVEVLKAYANAVPMTGHDIYALQDHQKEFETFKEIYYGYLEFYRHLNNKPGSEAYNEAMMNFRGAQEREGSDDGEVEETVKESKATEGDTGPDLPPPAP